MGGTRAEPDEATGPPKRTTEPRRGVIAIVTTCPANSRENRSKQRLNRLFLRCSRNENISSDCDAVFLREAAQRFSEAVATLREQRVDEAAQNGDIEAAQHQAYGTDGARA